MYWFWIILIGVAVGILIDLGWMFSSNKLSKSKKKEPFHLEIKSLKIHHSCVGLICIVVAFFIYTSVFIGIGLGIILGHTLRGKKLVFIER